MSEPTNDTYEGVSDRWQIGHFFADVGVESEPLSAYGEVWRYGLDPRETRFTDHTVAVDLSTDVPPVPVDGFDLGVFHPPCHKWTQRDDEDAENLIPRARELAEKYCDEWIIENQEGAPLRNPVVLDGSMFGLPVEYKRAFETSYEVVQPRRDRSWKAEHRVENTRPKPYWKAVKGVTGDYPSKELILSGTPACYVHYLVRPLVDPYHEPDTEQSTLIAADGGGKARSLHTANDRSGGGR